jgi:hypothetical protein
MKKRLFILLVGLVISLTTLAQTVWFTAFQFAYRETNWSSWSPWQTCNIDVKFDYDADQIIIYSRVTQVYQVYTYDGEQTDYDGGEQVQFGVIDQDNDRGKIRLRVERNGNSQIYVDFLNVHWVYNVRRQ